MLHELLVALSGLSGSIFVDKELQGFQVSFEFDYKDECPHWNYVTVGYSLHHQTKIIFDFCLGCC